jgi:hypothetical protein
LGSCVPLALGSCWTRDRAGSGNLGIPMKIRWSKAEWRSEGERSCNQRSRRQQQNGILQLARSPHFLRGVPRQQMVSGDLLRARLADFSQEHCGPYHLRPHSRVHGPGFLGHVRPAVQRSFVCSSGVGRHSRVEPRICPCALLRALLHYP